MEGRAEVKSLKWRFQGNMVVPGESTFLELRIVFISTDIASCFRNYQSLFICPGIKVNIKFIRNHNSSTILHLSAGMTWNLNILYSRLIFKQLPTIKNFILSANSQNIGMTPLDVVLVKAPLPVLTSSFSKLSNDQFISTTKSHNFNSPAKK